MNIDDIINTKEKLLKELQMGLSTMIYNPNLSHLKVEMEENQARCPHFDSNYNWVMVDDICPYCGKKLTRGDHHD